MRIALPNHLRPRRDKIFGPAPCHPLDGNAKARVWAAAAAYNAANRQPGQQGSADLGLATGAPRASMAVSWGRWRRPVFPELREDRKQALTAAQLQRRSRMLRRFSGTCRTYSEDPRRSKPISITGTRTG
jgi:hypothetical protein